jgi:hypothetical protein
LNRLLVGLTALLLAASPALGDVTAVYKHKWAAMSMTVEIADDGKVRYQMSAGNTYGLVLDGVDYFVQTDARGQVVDRVNDLVTAQKEAMADFLAKMPPPAMNDGPKLIPFGKVTINGREGRAFVYESQKDAKEADPVVVVSDDPKLATLGRVMASQFSKSTAMLGGMMGRTPSTAAEMETALNSGAAISFAGMELVSISDAKIDPKRFELPAEPETLDQIRARMKPLPSPPTAAPVKP